MPAMQIPSPTGRPLRILFLEDRAVDLDLIQRELHRQEIAFVSHEAHTEAGFIKGLQDFDPEIVLADYSLPGYDALQALATCRRLRPGVPFLFVSGAIGEELGVDALHNGATDYVFKHRLARLGPAVRRAVRERDEQNQRQNAERALRYERERLVSIAAVFPGAIYSLWQRPDDGFCFRYASPGIVDIYGYEPEKLIEDAAPAFERHHPEDRPAIRSTIRLSAQRLSPWHAEFRVLHPVKGEIWVECHSMPARDPQGGVLWQGFLVDITARKQAESDRERLRRRNELLVRALGDVVYEQDLRSRTIEWNGATELVLGYSLAEIEPSEEWWLDRVHPDDRRLVRPNPAQEAPERVFQLEYRFRHRLGHYVWMRDLGVTLGDERSEPLRKVGVFRDITMDRDARERLKVSERQLRALSAHLENLREQERTRISREIHDQLGQILTALKIDLRWLEAHSGTAESPVGGAWLDRLVAASALVDETIGAVQRISAELRPSVLDKLGLGAALGYEAKRFAQRTGVHCEVRLLGPVESIPAEVSTVLFRVFQEALTNVARHAQASNVDVLLARRGASLDLEIRDDGRGIPEDQLAQSDSLGLVGMRERLAALGGTLRIERRQPSGTELLMALPLFS